jgi:transcriptional regulator with XRE-family HTH domain
MSNNATWSFPSAPTTDQARATMTKKELGILAANLKRLRGARELSQQGLAKRAGLSVSMVAQIEQGHKKDPRISTVTALSGALGVSLDDLLRGSKRPARRKGNSVGKVV